MIGVDLTKISRFENKDEKFAKKILSNEEYKEWEKQKSSKFLATRWAIKEAIYKADNNFYEFKKIDILNGKFYSHKNFNISVSNEDDYIIAFVTKKEIKNETKS